MNAARRAVLILGSMVFLFTVGCTNSANSGDTILNSKSELSIVSPRIGDAQRFTLQDLDGHAVSLDGLLKEKKAVLLNFWATWCPPCREEIPDLIRLQGLHGSDAFTVLGVDVGESHSKVSAFVERMGINYPVVLDRDSAVSETYGIVGIPTSLLIGSDGTILGEYHAATPKLFSDVEKALK